MTWPLVNPTAGYSTLSRLDRLSARPSTSTSTRAAAYDFLAAASCASGSLRLGPPTRALRGAFVLLLALPPSARRRSWPRRCSPRARPSGPAPSPAPPARRSITTSSPCGLALDHVEHALAVLVAVLVGLEVRRQRLDQLLGHRRARAWWSSTSPCDRDLVELVGRHHLVGEEHRLHREQRPSCGRMATRFSLERITTRAMRHPARVLHGVEQQLVGLGRAGVRAPGSRGGRRRSGRSGRARRSPRCRSCASSGARATRAPRA